MADGKVTFELAAVKKCKKCNDIPVVGLNCLVCGGVMHPGCVKYYPKIIRVD